MKSKKSGGRGKPSGKGSDSFVLEWFEIKKKGNKNSYEEAKFLNRLLVDKCNSSRDEFRQYVSVALYERWSDTFYSKARAVEVIKPLEWSRIGWSGVAIVMKMAEVDRPSGLVEILKHATAPGEMLSDIATGKLEVKLAPPKRCQTPRAEGTTPFKERDLFAAEITNLVRRHPDLLSEISEAVVSLLSLEAVVGRRHAAAGAR